MTLNNIILAPSILAADFTHLHGQIRQAERAGADWIHCDVMDGHFVPNISFGPLVVAAARRCTKLPLDVHLMIEHPESYISEFRTAGADRITVHVEACRHLHRVVDQIHETGAAAGVALNPATSLTSIEEILQDVDLLLLMTVNPGFGGQTFIDNTLSKIQRARQMIHASRRAIFLEVDGGIDLQTTPAVVKAGADVLVAGTSIFGANDISAACKALQEAAWNATLVEV